MSTKDIAVKVENISKIYRIGLKEDMHDSFARTMIDFLKSPWKNYRKYRSLYRFDDITHSQSNSSSNNSSDILWALRDVSFEVKKGEAIGIIGRNGAGKSTLLKILCRITEPTSGRVEIRGRVSSLLEVGTGFHQELTGRENIYLNGTMLGMTKREVDFKFDEIVDFSGVERFIDTPVKRYSSGMKVRLAFAVAAHLEPEILLIDEVLAVGDSRFQKKCLNKMENISQRGRTVLFVSHNMQAVIRLCKRTIMLDESRVLEDGPSHNVVSSYLSYGTGMTASREWTDAAKAPGGDVARLRAVRVKTADGRISETIDIRKPVWVEMEYDVLKPGYMLMPHYEVHNEEGVYIFTTIDLDPEWRRRPRPVGLNVSTVSIPGNFLSEGRLFLDAWIMTMNPFDLEFVEYDAVSFQVIDSLSADSARGDYGGSMKGVVRPLLKWTTRLIDD